MKITSTGSALKTRFEVGKPATNAPPTTSSNAALYARRLGSQYRTALPSASRKVTAGENSLVPMRLRRVGLRSIGVCPKGVGSDRTRDRAEHNGEYDREK